ncbi:hypothetical protein ABID59_005747 [Bradyrhizobium sp. S3.3.6]
MDKVASLRAFVKVIETGSLARSWPSAPPLPYGFLLTGNQWKLTGADGDH